MPRREHDQLGERDVADDVRHGIHTLRALENFPLLGQPVHPSLARAYGAVKLAALRTNRSLGYLPDAATADALERACLELFDGRAGLRDRRRRAAGRRRHQHQHERERGAGQPRARDCSAGRTGSYDVVSPTDHVNLHQSTNDTFPTALRIAAIWGLRDLERAVLGAPGGVPGPASGPSRTS